MESSNSHVSLLAEEKVQVLKELLHACVDEICGYPKPSYSRFDKSVNWSKEEYEEAYQLFSTLLRNPVCLYLVEEKMPQEYHELPKHVQENVLTCLKVRREQLTNALLMEYTKDEMEIMRDFDWKLKLVMGSSKLATLREPLLQLDLVLEDKKSKRILGVELNKEELERFISTMETIVR